MRKRGDSTADSPTSKTQLPSIDSLILSRLTREELQLLSQKINETLQTPATSPSTAASTAPSENIPAQIFSSDLAPAEAVVKYLKEDRSLSYHEIGLALNRDERGIWGTYRRAHQKLPSRYAITAITPDVPLTLLASRTHSILENVITYLVNTKGMGFGEVARLLSKSYSTIYTTYTRASRKSQRKDAGNTTPNNKETFGKNAGGNI